MLVEFRRARPEDLEAIVAMLVDDELGRQREATTGVDGSYRAAFDAIDDDPRQLLVVGALDGMVVATLQLSFIPNLTYHGSERAQIEGVRVAATRRSEGVGRAMVEWAVDAARRRGCVLMQLTTDARRDDARRFYESLGFVSSHVGMKLALRDAG